MTQDEPDIIGKNVKDMYGTFMGKVAGTITDIDGKIQSVGIDCGAQGLQQIPYDQLVVQKNVVIFVPKWRLDSQRLIREKQLTLRRMRALIDIVSENDSMKGDAEIIREKYESRLSALGETERQIQSEIDSRLFDLEEQLRSTKMLLFDAKVQSKSNEITEDTFETVKKCTSDVTERITHEQAEITNIKSRISDLALEMQDLAPATPQNIQESAVSYLDAKQEQVVQTMLPEAPTEPVAVPDPIGARAAYEEPAKSEASSKLPSPPQSAPETKNDHEEDWLARMGAQ